MTYRVEYVPSRDAVEVRMRNDLGQWVPILNEQGRPDSFRDWTGLGDEEATWRLSKIDYAFINWWKNR